MTDRDVAADAVRALGVALHMELPAEMIAELATTLAERLGGKSWEAAVDAGKAAAEAIRTEADAERARRARLGEE